MDERRKSELGSARPEHGGDGPRDHAASEAAAGKHQTQASGGASLSSAQSGAHRPEMRRGNRRMHATPSRGNEGAQRGRQVSGFEQRRRAPAGHATRLIETRL